MRHNLERHRCQGGAHLLSVSDRQASYWVSRCKHEAATGCTFLTTLYPSRFIPSTAGPLEARYHASRDSDPTPSPQSQNPPANSIDAHPTLRPRRLLSHPPKMASALFFLDLKGKVGMNTRCWLGRADVLTHPALLDPSRPELQGRPTNVRGRAVPHPPQRCRRRVVSSTAMLLT